MDSIQYSFSRADWWCAVVGLSACLIAAPGCQTLDANLATLLGDTSDQVAQATAPESGGPTYSVEFRPDERKPQVVTLPLNGTLYVQQALEQTGALKKFRRMRIEIYRQLPQGGGHKIAITYDRAKKRVEPGSDYAIHPNDRIVVTEDTSTILDDMLERLGGSSAGPKRS